VIDSGALISVLGEPVKEEGFREIAGDLRMSGTLLHAITELPLPYNAKAHLPGPPATAVTLENQ
jgi:hypothetical protein